MSIVEAVGLGLLQGATEFLPISSSGHLLVAREWVGIAEPPLLFDVLLHVATLFVVCYQFRRRLAALLRAGALLVTGRAASADRGDLRLLAAIAAASAATAVVGFAVSRFLLPSARTLTAVSIAFIATAAILLATRLRRPLPAARQPGPWLAIAVGVAQGIAVLPGISRAGATVAVCLLGGTDRGRAGEFAFLVSVPAVLGALVLSFDDAGGLIRTAGVPALAAGFVAALAVGALCLRALLAVLHRDRLAWFAVYLLPLGVIGLLVR